MSGASLSLLLVAVLGFVIATLLTPAVARLAVVRGWLDHPDGHRKTHSTPIPTVGGIAVVVGFVVTLAMLPSLAAVAGEKATVLGLWVPLALASVAVSAVGIADDLRGVSPLAKLAVQTGAAVFLFYSGFRVEGVSNPLGGTIQLGALALPLTVLWLVGMSNAFNLIDGLDGLAAGLALVSTGGLLTAAALSGRHETALVAAALAGALLGFLPYNFNPARVFLGDCGALPVGFILAAIAVQSSIKTSAAIAVVVPLLALALPILDVGLSVVRRVVRRRPVFGADRDHIHHRLVEMGLTPRRAVVTLYGVAVLFTALALAVAAGPRQVTWAAAAIVVLLVWAGVRALGYWEVTEFQRSFLTRVTAGLRTSGDAALRGLELDLARTVDREHAWGRLCETAWALGFWELRVVPRSEGAAGILGRVAAAPDNPVTDECRGLLGEATWAFAVEADGRIVAEVVARRSLDRADFDPGRFVAAVQRVVGLTAAPGRPVPEAARSTVEV